MADSTAPQNRAEKGVDIQEKVLRGGSPQLRNKINSENQSCLTISKILEGFLESV